MVKDNLNMLIDIILILIIFFSLGGIIFIFLKKLPLVAAIDLKESPKKQQDQVKQRLIEERLKRQIQEFKKKLANFFSPFINKLIKINDFFKNKIQLLEEQYLERKRILFKKDPIKVQKRIKELFTNGKELLKSGNLKEAKKCFMEIISLNPRQIAAYKLLGEIYLLEKNYHRAEEVLNYSLKLSKQALNLWQKIAPLDGSPPIELNRQLITAYFDLGNFYKITNNYQKALSYFQKVIEAEPNNPKILDFLIELSIILKDKNLAQAYLWRLKEVNPENQKIGEWEEKIQSLE